ncbi:hypothetical protein [Halomonas saccharevitans]|uniref:hypothetical protein n=1 Tax=Halomonas saccharevitans TaxID=416872 RepID=UPI0011139502|nr:hypothetical protein [Halomonas saccharevitans]
MDTDLVITFAQQQTYWPGLTVTQWISSVAVLATVGILVAALTQWGSSRKAHKQSHLPIIRSDFQLPSESSTGRVEIKNCGLGPALLQEINIYVLGEKVEGCLSESSEKALLKVFAKANIKTDKEKGTGLLKIAKTQDFQKNYPISANESKEVVEFHLTGMGSNEVFSAQIKEQNLQLLDS